MAVHKVPQDVEAEDKFLGPLTFKQFLFTGGAAICGYLIFLTLAKGIWPISVIFAVPFTVFAFLAFPWSKEQPTELWLAARIRFLIKPRKRIWDQSGLKDLVTVTAPKQIVHNFTDGLDQSQVQDRLSALATMVDSRGWAVKNYSGNEYEDPSDRLADGNIATSSPVAVLENPDDVMDEDKGVIAQQFDSKIKESEQKHKSETMRLIKEAREEPTENPKESSWENRLNPEHHKSAKLPKHQKQEDFWFMHQQQNPDVNPNLATFQANPVIHPGNDDSASIATTTTANQNDNIPLDEDGFLAKAHEKHRRDAMQTHSSHIRTVSPLGTKPAHEPVKKDIDSPVTTEKDPDILKLASNNDLNLDTLSRTAKRDRDLPEDEVVISFR